MERQFFIGKILVNFYLRNPKSSKPTMIYMVVRFDKKNYAFSTKAKVYPYQWDKNTQEAICDIGLCKLDNLNNMKANNTIAAFKEKMYHLKSFLCNNPQEIVTLPRLLTEMFAEKMGRKKKMDESKVLDVVELIEKELSRDTSRAESTNDNYLKVMPDLKEFIIQRGVPITEYRQMDNDFFYGFTVWYAKKYKGQLQVSTVNSNLNYARSAIVEVGTSLNLLTKTEVKNIVFEKFPDKTPDNHIFLRNHEIVEIYNYKPENDLEDQVRDLFLTECLFGLRFQDIEQITLDATKQVQGVNTINVKIKKVQDPAEFDFVFEIAKDIILKKYKCQLPKLTNKRVNKLIKVICKKIGGSFNDDIPQYHHFIGEAEVRSSVFKKYDLVSTHTGRRTFVTLLSLRGWNYNEIARYTKQSIPMIQHYDKSKTLPAEKKIFENTYKNNPEQIVWLCGEDVPELLLPTPQLRTEKVEVIETSTKFNGVHTNIVNSVDEAKKVLNYLGADVDDYIDVDDIDVLLEMIGYYHTIIRKKYGSIICDVKEIFNKYADSKMRKQHLHNLLENMENEKQG